MINLLDGCFSLAVLLKAALHESTWRPDMSARPDGPSCRFV